MSRAIFLAALVMGGRVAVGGVVLDGSFGTSGALPGPNYMIQAGFGKTVGNNLFHSFSQFNLINGEIADFSGPNNIRNIISRVTGGTASSIDGTIRSDIQGANLFFLNPSGVMFGPNAQIDITGSFAVSTANYLKLADGGRFNASLGGSDMLTSAPVSAFGFINSAPAPITVAGSNLILINAGNLAFVGGDVTVQDGSLLFPKDGTLSLTSIASPGELPFDITDRSSTPDTSAFTKLGSISTSAEGNIVNIFTASRLVIRGGQLTASSDIVNISAKDPARGDGADVQLSDNMLWLNGSTLKVSVTQDFGLNLALRIASPSLLVASGASINTSATLSSGEGGRAEIRTSQLSLFGGQINCESVGAGAGPELSIFADSVSIGPNSAILSLNESAGPGGSVRMEVSGPLSITGDGMIESLTQGLGTGADLVINAGSLQINGQPSLLSAGGGGILSAVENSAPGTGGNIFVTAAGDLTVLNTGIIQARTDGIGHGGNIDISANTISVQGAQTSIATTVGPSGNGVGGDLTLNAAGMVELTDGAAILAQTNGIGHGGNLVLQTATLMVSNGAGVGANTINTTVGGPAGNVNIDVTGSVELLTGGQISDSTLGPGPGGEFHLMAGALLLSGAKSSIIGQASGAGNGGNLQIDVAGSVEIKDGAEISMSTSGSGESGSLTMNAASLAVGGTGSAITAQTLGAGNAGSLQFNLSGSLELTDGADITVNTAGSGHGGKIDIHAGSLNVAGINATSPSQIAAQTNSTGMGGDIDVQVTGAIDLETGGRITAATLGAGTGGHILINGANLSATGDGTGISAQTMQSGGPGGNLVIQLSGQLQLVKGAQIVAGTMSPGAPAGNISISAQSIGLSAAAGIGSESLASNAGSAGSINIVTTGGVNLSASAGISSLSQGSGKAGSVAVEAGGRINLADSTISVAAAKNDAGQVEVSSSRGIDLKRSAITARAGGTGGNIVLAAHSLTLNSSRITANAIAGNGGMITVNIPAIGVLGSPTDYVIVSPFVLEDGNSRISASSQQGLQGILQIDAPKLDISAELVPLPDVLVTAANQLRERCTALLLGDFSSFISLGRGGTEEEPDELEDAF